MSSFHKHRRFGGRTGLVWMLLALVLAASGEARAVDRDKLRAAAPLPAMETGFHFDFGEVMDAPPDEAATRAQISADAARPVTGEGLLRLGDLYSRIKEFERSRESYARAIPLLRQSSATHPDAASFVQLGTALQGARKLDEARDVLRRAVKLAPRNALAWTMLGEVLLQSSTEILLPSKNGFHLRVGSAPSLEGLDAALLSSRPAPEAMARAQALLDEAGASYERAVQVAPDDPQVLTERMGFRVGAAFGSRLLQALRADETATLGEVLAGAAQAAFPALLSPETLAQLQTIARLKPGDVGANGAAALATLYGFALSNERELPLKDGLQSLPAPVAAQMRELMGRLTVLCRGEQSAAPALEALGVLGFLLNDPSTVQTLRGSLALDPSRVQAGEMLISVFAGSERFEELVALLQSRLRRKDTARDRLLLAKAYEHLGRPQDAQAQVDAALEREPDDATANLARLALLLRAGQMTQAAQQTQQVARLFASPAKPSRNQALSYATLRGIFLGLSGQTEAARKVLQTVLAADARNEAARQALAALDSQGPNQLAAGVSKA